MNGTLLSDKVFIAETNSGDITVPDASEGDRCKIITNTGDIKIDVIT